MLQGRPYLVLLVGKVPMGIITCSILPKWVHDVDGISVNDEVGLYSNISARGPVDNGYSALAFSTFRGMTNPPTNLSSVADSGFENALELSAPP